MHRAGPVDCGYGISDMSVFTLIRGVYDLDTLQINLNGVVIPKSARLITQQNAHHLEALDYYNLVDVHTGSGAVVMTTLAIVSGDANFMEGCFHFFSPQNATFPGQIMATGTEDYYDSGYYFIDAFPLHLPSTGFTYNEQVPNYGGYASAMKWSAYRMHTVDQLLFSDGGKLSWRNGDVAIPGQGKCHHPTEGTPVGNPTDSYVHSLAYVYVW